MAHRKEEMLKLPALAGSFSISSLPLAEQDALDMQPMEAPSDRRAIGEADLASFSCFPKPPALAGGVFTLNFLVQWSQIQPAAADKKRIFTVYSSKFTAAQPHVTTCPWHILHAPEKHPAR